MKDFIEKLLGQTEEAAAITAEYESRVRALSAGHALKLAVSAAGGRNLTAIRALLDEQAIACSEDMDAAAKLAVGQVKRENPYLFAQLQVSAPGTGTAQSGTDYTVDELGRLSMAEYRRYRKGN